MNGISRGKVVVSAIAVFALAAFFVAAAMAWPNTTSGQVTATPACDNGEYKGDFEVAWDVTQNVDDGWTLKSVKPNAPHKEKYPASQAGQEVSFSFELTQTRGSGQDKEEQTETFTGKLTLPGLETCNPPEEKKVIVCKYVGTPGVDERLQTGDNPIQVGVSSIPGFNGTFPYEFADQHGKSVAIRYATSPQDKGELSECGPPAPDDVYAATAVCDEAGEQYTVSGTVNGQAATVSPTTIPGGFSGQTEITVTLGQKTGKATVTTDGTCVEDDEEPIEVRADVHFTNPTCTAGASVQTTPVTGVLYQIVGSVAAGQKVTVTATASAGYVLVGQSVWEHTFSAAPTDCNPVTPPCPGNPGGMEPNPPGGQDGKPGNDRCKPDETPPPKKDEPPTGGGTPPSGGGGGTTSGGSTTPPTSTPPKTAPPKAQPKPDKPKTGTTVVVKTGGPKTVTPPKETAEELPFTGLPLGGVALLGVLLSGAGFLLRRFN